MKKFKIIDILVQGLLVILFTIAALIKQDSTFIWGYFFMGGWQAISMLFHYLNKWNHGKGNRRYYYTRVSLICLLMMGMSFLLPPLFVFWYLMLFASPFMALYYLAICYHEVFYPAKRPLELI